MENSGYSFNSPGTVSGVFFSRNDANNAYHSLLQMGHTEDDISVLMSDETLNMHQNPAPDNPDKSGPEPKLDEASNVIASAIISIATMISLPDLGIAISNKLFKTYKRSDTSVSTHEHIHDIVGSKIPKDQSGSYGDSMKEGGIIISVDPRNKEEKLAIVKNFRASNGHDILGDDGYTELD